MEFVWYISCGFILGVSTLRFFLSVEPSWLGCLKVRSDVAVGVRTGMTTFPLSSRLSFVDWVDGGEGQRSGDCTEVSWRLLVFQATTLLLDFTLRWFFWDERVRVWSTRTVWRSPGGSPAEQRRRPGMTQVFLVFLGPRCKCWDGSQFSSTLPLHASHVALPN
jgi:hypothetical protein